MEYREFTAKNLDDAITEACEALMVTSDRLDYEVVSSGSSGFLGIASKPAIFKARIKEETPVEEVKAEPKKEEKSEVKKEVKKEEKKEAPKEEVKAEKKASADINGDELVEKANAFLKDVFGAMTMDVNLNSKFNDKENILDVELSGDEMGVLIGKRGQTLDSLQYLISLVVNRETEEYIHVKVDT